MPWLMVLLVLGTVAQRYIGLYESQKLFFGSFILWVGFVPLPGAYTTIGVIALGLLAKILLRFKFNKKTIGVLITHASALLLLIGGLVTAMMSEEAYIALGENEIGNLISDYHARELVIKKNNQNIATISDNQLYKDNIISDKNLPFSLKIINYCYQCILSENLTKNEQLKGLAEKIAISSNKEAKDDAQNQSGTTFLLTGASEKDDGIYVSSELLNQQPQFTLGKDTYDISIQAAKRPLPFAIKLLNFEKTEYPGTEIPRTYSSQVQILDGELKLEKTIEMNQPLRYRGYTLYQSSFIDKDGKLSTVLTVVKNVGAIFPYLAVIFLCVGLFTHILTVLRKTDSHQEV